MIAVKVLGLCDSEIGGSEASNSNGNSINSIVGDSKARICRALSQYAGDDAYYGSRNNFHFWVVDL
jgi:hypothetical protein